MPTTDPKKTVDMSKILRVYSGSSNRPLAQKIANQLGVGHGKCRRMSIKLRWVRYRWSIDLQSG